MFNQDQLLFILFKKGKKEFQAKLSLHACFHFGSLLSFQAVALKKHNLIYI